MIGTSRGRKKNVIFHPPIGLPNCRVTSRMIAFASLAVSGLQAAGSSRNFTPDRRASTNSAAASSILVRSMTFHSPRPYHIIPHPVLRICQPTAIDRHRPPRDVTRGIAAQERSQRPDILRIDEPLGRLPLCEIVARR